MDYYTFTQQTGGLEWPYPIEYEKETRLSADVLVIGGGLAGCFAAIHAARRGASVIVMEKGATVRSGAAGAGIDHWMFAVTNPASAVTPDEMLAVFENMDPFEAKHSLYIAMNESYEALLDMEEMGVKVRDTDGDFDGAPFRDEKTKLLFAYDYDGRYCIRLFGAKLKPALYREMLRLKITILDRTMGTMLLTEDGKAGNRIIGATGFNVRTGRFYAVNAKATVLATAKPLRLWEFGTEKVGSNAAHDDPNCAGDGDVMAWRAGAKLIMMERSNFSSGAFRYPAYSTGNPGNTWYPATIVDSQGKTIPWVDRDGNVVEDPDGRTRCAEGQTFFLPHGASSRDHTGYSILPDLNKRIASGEYKLPFYADLTEMPRYEREAIFGLMVGNEGKTRIPVFNKLTKAGFDPSIDMLQANIMHPSFAGANSPWWLNQYPGSNSVNVREVAFFNYGGLAVDWELKTSLEGLFAAGNQTAGVEGAATAAAMGRYCGRNVARYIQDKAMVEPVNTQIESEKQRVYAPLKNKVGFGWKEIQIGLCRVMQDHVGEVKTKEILETGLWWLNSIRENELAKLHVANPHELARGLECEIRLSVGEIIIYHSLSRCSSSMPLDFKRLDYPETKNPEEDSYIALHLENGIPVSEEMSLKFWLEGNNAPSYAENYQKYCCKD
jgi:succinate dehydrogenase/fumarate reductase flavoprotein subunit